MREAPAQFSERTRHAIQDHTAMATLVRAFEQVRAFRMSGGNLEYAPDGVAHALLVTLDNDELRRELTGTRILVDLQSPLGRRAHRLGLLVRRATKPRG